LERNILYANYNTSEDGKDEQLGENLKTLQISIVVMKEKLTGVLPATSFSCM
jgi:hypothetical protein